MDRVKERSKLVLGCDREIDRLGKENRFLASEIARLRKILRKHRISEEELERVKPEKPVLNAQSLAEDRQAFKTLIHEFPNNCVWNAVRRGGVTEFSELVRLVKSGEIRLFKGIGADREEFLRKVLKKFEKGASP